MDALGGARAEVRWSLDVVGGAARSSAGGALPRRSLARARRLRARRAAPGRSRFGQPLLLLPCGATPWWRCPQMFGEERSLEKLSKQDAVALLSTIPVGRRGVHRRRPAFHRAGGVRGPRRGRSDETSRGESACQGSSRWRPRLRDRRHRRADADGWSVVVMGVATRRRRPRAAGRDRPCGRDVRTWPEGRLHQVAAHRGDRAAGVGRERPKSRGSPLTGRVRPPGCRIQRRQVQVTGGRGSTGRSLQLDPAGRAASCSVVRHLRRRSRCRGQPRDLRPP